MRRLHTGIAWISLFFWLPERISLEDPRKATTHDVAHAEPSHLSLHSSPSSTPLLVVAAVANAIFGLSATS